MARILNTWLCFVMMCCFEPLNASGLTSNSAAALDFNGEAQLPLKKSTAEPTKKLMVRTMQRAQWSGEENALDAETQPRLNELTAKPAKLPTISMKRRAGEQHALEGEARLPLTTTKLLMSQLSFPTVEPTKLLMRSMKAKRAGEQHAQATSLGKDANGTHPAQHDDIVSDSPGHSIVDIKNVDVAHGKWGNCDTTPIDTDISIKLNHQPNSSWWRLRMYEPCQVWRTKDASWQVKKIRFYKERCDAVNATTQAIPVVDSWTSGMKNVKDNMQLAFDKDAKSYWEGIGDKDGQIWIAVRLATFEEVWCVKFIQCDCPHSARWPLLEFSEHYWPGVWQPVTIKGTVAWGEESVIKVIGYNSASQSTLMVAIAATFLAIMYTTDRSYSL